MEWRKVHYNDVEFTLVQNTIPRRYWFQIDINTNTADVKILCFVGNVFVEEFNNTQDAKTYLVEKYTEGELKLG